MAGCLVTVKLFGRGSVTRRAANFAGCSRPAVVQVVVMFRLSRHLDSSTLQVCREKVVPLQLFLEGCWDFWK